jgi:hypothetical protein
MIFTQKAFQIPRFPQFRASRNPAHCAHSVIFCELFAPKKLDANVQKLPK